MRTIDISFQIHFFAPFSKAIYISGSSIQLGGWDLQKARRLTWQEDNWWIIEIKDITEESFDYKFFISDYELPVQENTKWEQGPNRTLNLKGHNRSPLVICDVWEFKKVILRLFDYQQTVQSSCEDSYQSKQNNILAKNLEYPSREKFYVTGNSESLGGLTKLKKMKKRLVQIAKQGQEIVFWEKQFLIKSSQQNLKYKYAYKSEDSAKDQLQRRAQYINFSKNDIDFQGAFCITDKWFPEQFTFDQITPNISIGPYLENSQQIQQLAEAGVKAVFNLQTKEDMDLNWINWENVQKIYKSYGISIIHCSVIDMDIYDMVLKFDEVVEAFKKAIDDYKNVYIHCTSGIYRSAQVVIGFFHLYQGLSIKEAIQLVESKRPITRKNREYLRQIYLLKGGYRSIKQGQKYPYQEQQQESKFSQQQEQQESSPKEIISPQTTSVIEKKQIHLEIQRRHFKSKSFQNVSSSGEINKFNSSKQATFFSDQPIPNNKRRSSIFNYIQQEEYQQRIRI